MLKMSLVDCGGGNPGLIPADTGVKPDVAYVYLVDFESTDQLFDYFDKLGDDQRLAFFSKQGKDGEEYKLIEYCNRDNQDGYFVKVDGNEYFVDYSDMGVEVDGVFWSDPGGQLGFFRTKTDLSERNGIWFP